MSALTRCEGIRVMERFGPIDPYKHARIAGGMTMTAVLAAAALERGDTAYALKMLRDGLERYDPEWARHVWPLELEKSA